MAEVITSTKLKQKTKTIIDKVARTSRPIVISTYNEPRVILIKYHPDLVREKTPPLKDLKKHFIKTKQKVDSTKFFRTMRDAK